TRQ
ncbi:bacterial extracellular solute-binding s, 5 Middle family protein, partial [Vibrio parahaemolyticus V-223/04]